MRRTPVQRIHPPKPSQSRRRKPRVKSCQFILTDIRFLDYRISPYHKVFTNGWSLSYSRTNIIFRSDILLAHSVPLDVIAVLHPVSLRSRSIFVVYHHEPYSTRGLCPACHGFKLLRVGLGQSATICRYLPPGPPKKKSDFFGIGSYLGRRSNLNVAHVIQRWSISYHAMPRAPYESLANHSTLHRCSEDLKSVLLTTDGHDYLLCSGRPCAGTVSICSIKQ